MTRKGHPVGTKGAQDTKAVVSTVTRPKRVLLLVLAIVCGSAAAALMLGVVPRVERRACTREETERVVAQTPAAFVLPGPVNAGLVRRTDRATDTFADERSLHLALFVAACGTPELSNNNTSSDEREAILRTRLGSSAPLREHVRTVLELCYSGRLSLDYLYWAVRSAALLGVPVDTARAAALVVRLYDGAGGFRIAAGTDVPPSLAGTYYATRVLVALDDGTLSYSDAPLADVHRRVLAHAHPAGGFAEAAREQTWLRPAPHIVHVRRALHTLVLSRSNATAAGTPRPAVAPAYRTAAAFLRACYAPDGGFRAFPPEIASDDTDEGQQEEQKKDDDNNMWKPSLASDTAEGLAVAAMLRDYDPKLVDEARIEEARRYLSMCGARDGTGVLEHASSTHLSLEAAAALAALNSEFMPAHSVLLCCRSLVPAALFWVGVAAGLVSVLSLVLLVCSRIQRHVPTTWLRALLKRVGTILSASVLTVLVVAVLPPGMGLTALTAVALVLVALDIRRIHTRTQRIWVLVVLVLVLTLLPHACIMHFRPFLLTRTAWYALWMLWGAFVCLVASFVAPGPRTATDLCERVTAVWAATLLSSALVLLSRFALVTHLAAATGELFLVIAFAPAAAFVLFQTSALLGTSLAADPRIASSRLRRFFKSFASS